MEMDAETEARLEERRNRSPLEREMDELTSFAAELPATVPTEEVAARYSADQAYWEAEEKFKHSVGLASEAVRRALWGEAIPAETLERLPELLRFATDDLCEAIAEATAVASP